MIPSFLSSAANPTHRRRRLSAPLLTGLLLATSLVGLAAEPSAAAAPAPGEVQFMRDVAPIIRDRCISCHGPNDPEGGLRLDIFESMIKGDHPAVVPEYPEESEMIHRVTGEDASSRMPRDDDPLTPAQIDLLRRWIKAGAKFDGPDPKTPFATKPASGADPAAPAPHPVRDPETPPAK